MALPAGLHSDLARRAASGLRVLRLAAGLTLVLSAAGHLWLTSSAPLFWEALYRGPLPIPARVIHGLVELVVALPLAMGRWRALVYPVAGSGVLASGLYTWRFLATPVTASVGSLEALPFLAGLLVLWLMRRYDYWSSDARAGRRNPAPQ